MMPAREVGGDLYDFFLLDERPAVLPGRRRRRQGAVGAHLHGGQQGAVQERDAARAGRRHRRASWRAANAEVSRDNPEMLFVTAFAGILDLRQRRARLLQRRPREPVPAARRPTRALARIADGDGPPLCAVDDFDYRGAQLPAAPGELLCLVTDGVTEAQNAGRRAVRRTRGSEQRRSAQHRARRCQRTRARRRRCAPTCRRSPPAPSRPTT